MSNIVAIVGPSGSGKTTGVFPNPELGIKGLDPKETIFINVSDKKPSVRGWKAMYAGKPSEGGNLVSMPNGAAVAEIIKFANEKMPHIKNIVVDDAQYLQAFEFGKRTTEKGFDKFNDIFNEIYKPLRATLGLRDDLFVFFNFHQEKDGDMTQIKTCGKMISNMITIEGLFTEVLYTDNELDFATKQMKYRFRTQTNGSDTCKSRLGIFPKYIPNDYGVVREAIEKYDLGN